MNKIKSSASSLLAKPFATNGRTIRRAFDPDRQISPAARKRLQQLAHLPDGEIDYSDIPRLSKDFLETAIRNPYFRPVKQQITLRLDADVIAWLRQGGKGYQTRLNEILRREMRRELVTSLDATENARQERPARAPGSRVSLRAISRAPSSGTRQKAS